MILNYSIRPYGTDFILRVGDDYYIVNELAAKIIEQYAQSEDFDEVLERIATEENVDIEVVYGWFNDVKNMIESSEYLDTDELNLPSPVKVQWQVTHRCNLNCRHCWIAGHSKSDLSKSQLQEIANRLLTSDLFEITFTGGEPFLVDGFMDIVEQFAQSGIQVTIFTNGLLIVPFIQRLQRIKEKLKINVSLDGIGKGHDWMRGEGTYIQTVENIKLLTNCGINVVINTVLNKHNFHQVPEIFTLAKNINVSNVQISHLNLVGNAVHNQADLYMSEENLKEFKTILENYVNENSDARFLYSERPDEDNPSIYSISQDGVEEVGYEEWKCCAGRTRVTLKPDGTILCCPFFDQYSLGNILEKSLSELWNTEKRSEFIRFISKMGRGRLCAAIKQNEERNLQK